jgi:hypothetical protein
LFVVGRQPGEMLYDLLRRSIPEFNRNVKFVGSKKVLMNAYCLHIYDSHHRAVWQSECSQFLSSGTHQAAPSADESALFTGSVDWFKII